MKLRLVLFVLLTLLFMAFMSGGCDDPKPASAPGLPTDPGPCVANTSNAAPTAIDLFRLPGMDCMLTQNGLRVKAITARPGLRCTTEPVGGRDVEPALGYFLPYYVLDSRTVNGIEYFQLADSPRKDAAIGWMARNNLVRWDTRVGVRYVGVVGGERAAPLLVYGDKSALLELVKTGTTSQEPIARAVAASGRKYMPWPVIRVERIEIDNNVCELLEIAFLGEVPGSGELSSQGAVATNPSSALTDPEYQALIEQAKFVELHFVVDSTGSMEPWIAATRETIKDLSRKLAAMDLKPDLRLGLVAYQDYLDSVFVTRSFQPTADLSKFADDVGALKAEAGGDEPEAVYDGVLAGLNMHWESPFSRRVLVIVGDASAHEPGDKQNPNNISQEQLIARAKADGVLVIGLAVGGRSATPDKELRWKQFSSLAQGTGGECFEIEQADSVVQRVRKIMEDQIGKINLQRNMLPELRKGHTTGEIATLLGADVREVTEVMQFLQSRGLDPSRVRADGIGFSTGWILPEFRGSEIVQRECLISRGELDLMLASLNTFSGYLGADLGRRIAFGSLLDRTNPLAEFFNDPAGKDPYDVFLQARGVPVGRTSILRLSKDQVMQMSEERRALLRDKISRNFVPALTSWRNDDSVWRKRDADDWTWCPEKFLP